VEGEAEEIALAVIRRLTFNRARLGQRRGGPQYSLGEARTNLSTNDARTLWNEYLVTIPEQDRKRQRVSQLALPTLARNGPDAMAINDLQADALAYIDHPMKKTSDQ
jgi:hypothetical protein